jgi:hypothetical protein
MILCTFSSPAHLEESIYYRFSPRRIDDFRNYFIDIKKQGKNKILMEKRSKGRRISSEVT